MTPPRPSPSPGDDARAPLAAQVRTLLRGAGFRRLLAVRLVSQCGDGMFQAGLAALFFFSPQTMATAGSVTLAFAVLLLPFTLVGPFAGPLLDRWSRRGTLLVGNAVRVVLTLALAGLLLTSGVGPGIHVLALVTLGVNRFLLSALSAGVPLVVPRAQLVLANSATPTLGAVSAVVGAAASLLVGSLVPPGPGRDAAALVLAAAFFAAASALATRLGRTELGPLRPDGTAAGPAVREVLVDLADGVRHLHERRTPGAALLVLAGQRLVYGLSFLTLLLLARNLLADPADPAAGLAAFATLTAVTFAGNAVGVLVTAPAHRRVGPSGALAAGTLAIAASQALLACGPHRGTLTAAALLLGLGLQVSKISVDTLLHRDTDDAVRGRAFALHDVLFNGGFVAAAALGALVLPDTGRSPAVSATVALATAALAVWAARATRTRPR